MYIASIVGGLGNQMFQYAMAKSMAIRKHSSLRLDLSAYKNKRYFNPEGYLLRKVFGVDSVEANYLDYLSTIGINFFLLPLIRRGKLRDITSRIIFESRFFDYDDKLINNSHPEGAYINGYWQTENYFNATEYQIRTLFQFKPSIISERAKFFESKIRGCESVAVHVRRGDYISNPTYKKIYSICDHQYYKNAFQFMESRVVKPKFFVFTDDVGWVSSQDIFRGATVCTASEDGSWNDMYLMSICKHNIIANSSFSWWGAWLNNNPNKIVVCPSTWFIDGTEAPNLIPSSWVSIN